MICSYCGKEMTEADSCKEPLDLSVVPTELPPEVGLQRCHDCGVAPGGTHHPGCDVERCGRCGGQAISCGCTYANEEDDEIFEQEEPDAKREAEYYALRVKNRWTGVWPGILECHRLGLFCRDMLDGKPYTGEAAFDAATRYRVKWHVPCDRTDEGAHPDLNRWAASELGEKR